MTTATPESVGLSSQRLSRLDEAYSRLIEKQVLPCAVSVVARRGRLVHLHCQGLADIVKGRPVNEDTIFLVYSMSKPVTAAALLTLFEEGLFRLDDPVAPLIPEMGSLKVLARMADGHPELEDLRRPVTFRHLFTHTSGFCYPVLKGTPAERLLLVQLGGFGPKDASVTLAQFIPVLARAPLAHQPGEGWTYGFSIDVLGRLIEVLSGMPLDAFLERRIFGPLGMQDTFFSVPDGKRDRVALVYGKGPDGKLRFDEITSRGYGPRPAFLSGGGGLYSTAPDYLRFAMMLLNGGEYDGVRILGRRTVDLMRANHVQHLMDLPAIRDGSAFGPGCGYGLGGRVVVDESRGLFGSTGTYGWDGMAGTLFFFDPREELTALLLTHVNPWPANHRELFTTLVYQALA